jgi:hypothetical protein
MLTMKVANSTIQNFSDLDMFFKSYYSCDIIIIPL